VTGSAFEWCAFGDNADKSAVECGDYNKLIQRFHWMGRKKRCLAHNQQGNIGKSRTNGTDMVKSGLSETEHNVKKCKFVGSLVTGNCILVDDESRSSLIKTSSDGEGITESILSTGDDSHTVTGNTSGANTTANCTTTSTTTTTINSNGVDAMSLRSDAGTVSPLPLPIAEFNSGHLPNYLEIILNGNVDEINELTGKLDKVTMIQLQNYNSQVPSLQDYLADSMQDSITSGKLTALHCTALRFTLEGLRLYNTALGI